VCVSVSECVSVCCAEPEQNELEWTLLAFRLLAVGLVPLPHIAMRTDTAWQTSVTSRHS
jgi:hypothetical protein